MFLSLRPNPQKRCVSQSHFSSPSVVTDSVSRIFVADRKLMRPVVVGDGMVVFSRSGISTTGVKGFDSDGKGRNRKTRLRSKTNWIDFEESRDEEGYESEKEEEEEEEEEDDGDEEMRKRMKEMEERRELEKKADELQCGLVENGEESVEESEEGKRMSIRRELEKFAKQQEERRAMAKLMFDIGQKAYGRGMYGRAIEIFDGALTIIPRSTMFDGEVCCYIKHHSKIFMNLTFSQNATQEAEMESAASAAPDLQSKCCTRSRMELAASAPPTAHVRRCLDRLTVSVFCVFDSRF